MKLLGEGVYGKVFKTKVKNKEIARKYGSSKDLYNEYIVHQDIYYGVSQSCRKYIVKPHKSSYLFHSYSVSSYDMEYIQGETLRSFIKKHFKNERVMKSLIKQLKFVFSCIWSFGYIHSDAHFKNIIVLPTGKIKVLDFGFATKVKPVSKTNLSDDTKLKKWFCSQWKSVLLNLELKVANPNIVFWFPDYVSFFAETNKINIKKVKGLHNIK